MEGNLRPNKQRVKKYLMRVLLPMILLFSFTFNSYAQSNQTIAKAKTIYFYGYNFTQFKLINPEKVNDILIKYAFGVSGYLNKKFPQIDFQNNMNKNIIYKNESSDISNRSLEPYSFGAYSTPDPISKKVCLKIISEYKLQEKEGVGLIILMEYADKISESTRVRPVFFDIKTRNIIYSQPVLSKDAKGSGFTRHWGKSFLKSMRVLSKINCNKSSGWHIEVYEDPCGTEPKRPTNFNHQQSQQSKANREYKKAHKIWKDCKGM